MKKLVVLFALLSLFVFNNKISAQNNVGIGTNNPHPSSLLDLTANDKGLLIPRLTSTQRVAIVSPATGLLVYDTDFSQYWYFDGIIWTPINGVVGVTGPTGPQGIAGPTGLQGIAGIQGPTGPSGLDGVTGPTGLQGIQGVTGPTGASGLLMAIVDLTSADILALHVNSKILVSSPGAGKIVIFDQIVFSLNAGSTPYVNGTDFRPFYDGDNTQLILAKFGDVLMNSSINVVALRNSDNIANLTNYTAGINRDLVLRTDTPVPFLNGNGTAKIFITYHILTL